MGSTPQSTILPRHTPADWIIKYPCDGYDLVSSKETKELGHAYRVYLKDLSGRDRLGQKISVTHRDIYENRAAKWKNAVKVHCISEGKKEGYCGGVTPADIITQEIPVKLSDVRLLTVEQGKLVLFYALSGYRDILSYYPAFTVTDSMIGFNRSGQVKVWVNPRFGENEPFEQIDQVANDSLLIQKVATLVENKLLPATNGKPYHFPQPLRSSILNTGDIFETMTQLRASINLDLPSFADFKLTNFLRYDSISEKFVQKTSNGAIIHKNIQLPVLSLTASAPKQPQLPAFVPMKVSTVVPFNPGPIQYTKQPATIPSFGPIQSLYMTSQKDQPTQSRNNMYTAPHSARIPRISFTYSNANKP